MRKDIAYRDKFCAPHNKLKKELVMLIEYGTEISLVKPLEILVKYPL